MTLVKERVGTLQSRIETILGSERRLQVGGIVDGVRPGVRRKEFVVLVEAFAQVGAEAVIDGTPIRVVRIHVAKGYAIGQSGRPGVAASIQPSGLQVGQR